MDRVAEAQLRRALQENQRYMAIYPLNWHDSFPSESQQGAVSLGNFDGAHRGHATLIQALVRQARRLSGPAIVVTFDPHPLTLLRPGMALDLLTTTQQRARLLQELGADHVLILQVTPTLLELPAGDFFDQVLRTRLQARAIVEGPNFAFGHRREGNIEVLSTLCHNSGIVLEVIDPVQLAGEEVSSSRIRADLLQGNVRSAARALGRSYRIEGRVSPGQRRGRTIGFPTANLESVPTLIPADGVYAVGVLLPGGKQFSGAANIGPNPTFAEQSRKIEVHLLDFQGDLYGLEVKVDFLDRLRDTRPFSSVTELVRQLQQDIAQVRSMTLQP